MFLVRISPHPPLCKCSRRREGHTPTLRVFAVDGRHTPQSASVLCERRGWSSLSYRTTRVGHTTFQVFSPSLLPLYPVFDRRDEMADRHTRAVCPAFPIADRRTPGSRLCTGSLDDPHPPVFKCSSRRRGEGGGGSERTCIEVTGRNVADEGESRSVRQSAYQRSLVLVREAVLPSVVRFGRRRRAFGRVPFPFAGSASRITLSLASTN